MKINKVQIYDIELDKHSFYKFRWNPVVVKLETDEGIYGLGEVALAYGCGAKAAIYMIKELAERFLISENTDKIEAIWDTLFRQTFWGQSGGPVLYGAISAIDVALWDIKGKQFGVPVFNLLGGKIRETIRLYANNWYSNLISPEEYAEAAGNVVADGYNAFKFDPFSTSSDGTYKYPERNLDSKLGKLAYERIIAVREYVGSEIDILIEVHGNLGTTSAIEFGRRIEDLKPFFYEEPVDPLNVKCMKKVSENVNIPIAGGERLYTRYQFRPFIENQALDILQPDIGLTGGLTEAKKIATFAETYNLQMQPHNCGGPISTASSVQFDACTTNFIIQEWMYWDDDRLNIVNEPLENKAKNGYLIIPDTPGIGVEINDDYVRRFPSVVIS